MPENTNSPRPLSLTLFDTYEKKLFTISPEETVQKGILKIYHCGPTVYNYQHIGNLQSAMLGDTIVKIAKLAGWEVEYVENVTDVGHLVGDGDDGQNVTEAEDKLEKGAKREGKAVAEIVDFYTENYRQQAQKLNLNLPEKTYNPKATDYIPEQMRLALTLLNEKGAYLTEDGIYFDSLASGDKSASPVSTEELAKKNPEEEDFKLNNSKPNYTGRSIVAGGEKNPEDFALWKFVAENSLQKWRFGDFEPAVELLKQHAYANYPKPYLEKEELIEKLKKANLYTPIIQKALAQSWSSHHLQKRKVTNLPYLEEHIYAVTASLLENDWGNVKIDLETVLAVALLHDSVEDDPNYSEEQLREDFGPEIAQKVLNLTKKHEHKPMSWEEKIRLDGQYLEEVFDSAPETQAVKLADKLNNSSCCIDFIGTKDLDKEITKMEMFLRIAKEKSRFYELLEKLEEKYQILKNYQNLLQKWGCPGWHSECVAMICAILGDKEQFSFTQSTREQIEAAKAKIISKEEMETLRNLKQVFVPENLAKLIQK